MVAGQSISAAKEGMQNSSASARADTGKTESRPESKKKSINLLRGWPNTSLLPAAALRAASQTALSDPNIWVSGLEYAPDAGYQPLREALARWLGRFYRDVPISGVGGGVEPSRGRDRAQDQGRDQDRDQGRDVKDAADRITITGGASQSLACLLQSFTDPARTLAIWVVAPCYFLACPILADAGFAGCLRAVPEDDEGVDVAVLEREMRAVEQRRAEQENSEVDGLKYKDPGPDRKIYRHVVYCVPAFANPSGRTMTLARREALVDLARQRDALVICDDVYDMLQWHVEVPSSTPTSHQPSASKAPQSSVDLHKALLPRVADIDIARGRSPHDPAGKHFGHAVSNGSFSKLVAPGARTGWTYSTADFALGTSQTGSTQSGGAASQLAATIVCELLLSRADGSRSVSGVPLEDGAECQLDTHIRRTLIPSYARRHGILMRAVRGALVPLGVRVLEGSLCGNAGVYGGYFVWMMLPDDGTAATEGASAASTRRWPSARAIAARCRADEDLMIGNGELFEVHGDEETVRFSGAIRLCFSWEGEEELVEGVERLGRVMRRMLDEGPESWETAAGGSGGVEEAK